MNEIFLTDSSMKPGGADMELVNEQDQGEIVPLKTSVKLKSAYIDERVRLETVEVELNRTKIFVLDENGKLVKFSLISEH